MAAGTSSRYPVHEGLNIAIFCAALPVTWALLWVASHLSLGWALLSAWVFALANHTPFSLMHEAIHGNFSRNRLRNDLFGTLCAPALPSSFTMQKIAHLGHHRRNRTDEELYDYYLPGQSRIGRTVKIYTGNLFGFYWLCIPVGNLLYLLFPWMFTSRWFVEGPARALGFAPYLREIVEYSRLRIWLECLWALAYQVALWMLLDLSWQGWLLCYWAFALHWSALQYVDHAWSARDTIEGAWNLKVLPVTRMFSMNYHLHLAHHRYPQAPWTALPDLVRSEDPRPTFWRIYFRLWGGVRPAPPMGAPATLDGV